MGVNARACICRCAPRLASSQLTSSRLTLPFFQVYVDTFVSVTGSRVMRAQDYHHRGHHHSHHRGHHHGHHHHARHHLDASTGRSSESPPPYTADPKTMHVDLKKKSSKLVESIMVKSKQHIITKRQTQTQCGKMMGDNAGGGGGGNGGGPPVVYVYVRGGAQENHQWWWQACVRPVPPLDLSHLDPVGKQEFPALPQVCA